MTPVENELPGILQDLSDHAPEEFREATLMAAMPMLGTHHGMSPQTSRGNIRYLDALPKEFTKEDLVSLRLANNESPVVKTIIYRWAKEGQIDKIGTNLWKKVG